MLPYSCIHDVLAAHPFVARFGMSAREVYNALVHLDAALHRRAPATAVDETRVAGAREEDGATVRRCGECAVGHLLVDEHNGCEVCSECGLVQSRASINICPEFIKRNDGGGRPHRGGRVNPATTIPFWIVRRAYASTDEVQQAAYMDDLEHMNAYVHVAPDELTRCEQTLRRWDAGHFARDVRIAAALLHVVLRDRFMTEADMRRRMRTLVQYSGTETVDRATGSMVPTWSFGSERLPEVRDVVAAAPTFACARCGALEHTQKGARYHCRGR